LTSTILHSLVQQPSNSNNVSRNKSAEARQCQAEMKPPSPSPRAPRTAPAPSRPPPPTGPRPADRRPALSLYSPIHPVCSTPSRNPRGGHRRSCRAVCSILDGSTSRDCLGCRDPIGSILACHLHLRLHDESSRPHGNTGPASNRLGEPGRPRRAGPRLLRLLRRAWQWRRLLQEQSHHAMPRLGSDRRRQLWGRRVSRRSRCGGAVCDTGPRVPDGDSRLSMHGRA
jgi:hypothetical protein